MKNRIYLIFVVLLAGLNAGAFILLMNLWESRSPKSPQISSEPIIQQNAEVLTNQEVLWRIVQQWRSDSGYARYTENQTTCNYADKRIIDIQKEYSHDQMNRDMKNPKYQPPPGQTLSENLGGSNREGVALSGWLNSPPHRKALETNFPYSCLRCQNNYCVQIFSTY